MRRYNWLIICMIVIGAIACGEEKMPAGKSENDDKAGTEQSVRDTPVNAADVLEKKGIKVYPAEIAKAYPDAILKLNEKQIPYSKPGNYQFDFEVENYELAVQTDDADERHCANSAQGQHIHFIVNNGPYQAKYESSFEAELMEGNNVILAFLSRSYHESIKNGTAHILKNIYIGEEDEASFDLNGQHLFYSRPKGTYAARDAHKLLLDFYLVNTTLAEDGNRVQLSIDDSEFILSNWQAYFVEGLSKGKHRFRIRLIDSSGNLVEGPFNDSGEREITIE